MKTKWKLKSPDIEKIIDLYYDKRWSKNKIAIKFNVDHSTIHYHIRKHERNVYEIDDISLSNIPAYYDNTDFNGEIINKGSTYKEYLDVEQARRMREQSNCLHGILQATYRCKGCGLVHTKDVNNKGDII